MSYSKTIIVGHLGQDPKIHEFANGGGKVCNFSVATSRKWKDQQGQLQERTTCHNVKVFGK